MRRIDSSLAVAVILVVSGCYRSHGLGEDANVVARDDGRVLDEGPPLEPDAGPETFCYDDELQFPVAGMAVGECRTMEIVAPDVQRCLVDQRPIDTQRGAAVSVLAPPGQSFISQSRVLEIPPPGLREGDVGHLVPRMDGWPPCRCMSGSSFSGAHPSDGFVNPWRVDGDDPEARWMVDVLFPPGLTWEMQVCRER